MMTDKGTGSGDNVISLHPGYEILREEIKRLRTALSMLMLERDELVYHECKNIEMRYMLAVGGLEYRIYLFECEILRMKREIEIVQMYRNRQESFVVKDIETELDREFAQYQAELDAQMERMNAALERNQGEMLSVDESDELKRLYRALVKALHPDLHPGQSEAKVRLLKNAMEAYQRGDVASLRVISEMVQESVLPDDIDGWALLKREKERLEGLVQALRDEIAEVKSTFPYTMKTFVQDAELVRARKEDLEKYLQELNELHAIYVAKLAEMLG
jgi:hypothetical protein